MRIYEFLAAGVLSLASGAAQTKPVELGVLIKGLGDPDLIEVPALTQEIQNRGIGFDLGNQQLSALLTAATKGKRDPDQMAQLILTCLGVCQDCRSRLVAPMTTAELKTLLKWKFAPEAVLQEARVRGVTDMEISEPSANVLRESGASEELVALLVPDDKIPTIPLQEYKTLILKHAEEYDPSAPAGWLKVATQLPANNQSEFVFKHTGLFAKGLKGGEPTDLGAYFNKPAPRNTPRELVEFTYGLEGGSDDKHSGAPGLFKAKPKPKNVPIEASYLGPGPDGRNAFRVLITNKEGTPQQYSFYLRWKLRTAEKVPTPAPKR